MKGMEWRDEAPGKAAFIETTNGILGFIKTQDVVLAQEWPTLPGFKGLPIQGTAVITVSNCNP